jgi:hypothetical protein
LKLLETLAKSGLPTRAEITDAAMGQRAECVMLNKGTHILEAVKTLSGLHHLVLIVVVVPVELILVFHPIIIHPHL